MKIVALADLHLGDASRARVEATAHAAGSAQADVLVLAGDCTAQGPERIPEVLALLANFPGPRLLVPGNHDLWRREQPFDTWRIYDEIIPTMAAEYGFHVLDQAPLIVDDVAFVGCMGWYDYSFRQTTAPAPDMTVTPIDVGRDAGGAVAFSAVPGATVGQWEDLEAEDYAPGGLIWQTDGGPRAAMWNDAAHVDWGRSDPEMARYFAERLRGQLETVAAQVQRMVAVTHFVPFAELADYHLEDPKRAFARAYLGSPLLGEAVLATPGVELVIYGHRHRQEVREVHGLVAADAGVAELDAGPLLLTLPD